MNGSERGQLGTVGCLYQKESEVRDIAMVGNKSLGLIFTSDICQHVKDVACLWTPSLVHQSF